MAKLNGVFVSEDATRIIVGGREYVKSEGKAEAGDILRITESVGSHLTNGASYVVTEVGGWPRVIDNAGDDIYVSNTKYDVFKPVATAAETPPTAEESDNTVVYNGQRYRKVSRKAKVGELVLITDWVPSEHMYHDVKVGEILTAKSVVESGNIWYVNERKISAVVTPAEYVVLEPTASQYTVVDKPTVREVKRKAAVGERIRIVAASGNIDYDNGDEFEVTGSTSVGASFIDRVGDKNCARHREYVVLEPVKCCDKPAQPERLKVGDYAKALDNLAHFRKAGDIVKITQDDGTSIPFNTERLDGKYTGWANVEDLVRATDAEVAAALAEVERKKAEEAEEARWAAIGRKVGEIKAGDVVENGGELYTVKGVGEPGYIDAELGVSLVGGQWRYKKNVKLIAPVESLFNGNKVAQA